MSSLEEDIKGTLRTFAKDQLAAKDPDETIVLDVWQFDDEVKHIIDSKPIDAYDPDRYSCGGCTALYDAVCIGIDSLGKKFAKMSEDERPEDVLFVIVTDGMENASREFTLADVKKRIETQTNVYNWSFDFLASNIDVDAVAEDIGIADVDSRMALQEESFAEDIRERMNYRQQKIRERRRSQD
jgi:uncharacterized protein YegL